MLPPMYKPTPRAALSTVRSAPSPLEEPPTVMQLTMGCTCGPRASSRPQRRTSSAAHSLGMMMAPAARSVAMIYQRMDRRNNWMLLSHTGPPKILLVVHQQGACGVDFEQLCLCDTPNLDWQVQCYSLKQVEELLCCLRRHAVYVQRNSHSPHMWECVIAHSSRLRC